MTSTVKDVMTVNVIAVRMDAEFKEIIRVMRRRHFSAFPVLDSADRVVGVVSEADLLLKEAFPASPEDGSKPLRRRDRVKVSALTAGQLMTSPAITISPDRTVEDAARKMYRNRVKRMPVVSDTGRLVGIVSRVDLLGLYDQPDADIRANILNGIIAKGFAMDPGEFTVTVESGVVTLSGVVNRHAVAMSLLDAVWHADGVVDVRDRLSYPRIG